jgi:transposase
MLAAVLPMVGDCQGCRTRDRLIRQQRQQIARLQRDEQRGLRRLARLKKDNERLRGLLDEARRQPQRQTARFRRRNLKQRCRKVGRPAGHAADLRPTPTPEQTDRHIHVPCSVCPDCDSPLLELDQITQWQTDLPPIVPVVTKFTVATGYCPCCRRRVQGRHAEQISNATGSAGNVIGPVALTMAAELKHRLGVPYRKICDFLATYANLDICPATLIRAEQRLANLARPTFDLLLDALRRAGVVHADETGWRIGAVNAWLWVFSSKDITIYTIRTGVGARGHEVPQEILGPDFDGYLIIDGFKAYDVLGYAKGQCNAHLLRRAKNMSDTASSQEQALLGTLISLLQKAMDLAERREQLSAAGYERSRKNIEQRWEALLVKLIRRRRNSPELQRLINHIGNHYDEWLVFLREPEVPPTNNHAERMLRPAVISRKVGGCNKTLLGAVVHSILASLMATCHQQGRKFLELAKQLWSAEQPQAIALMPPPTKKPRSAGT